MWMTLLKAGCLATYALAGAALAGLYGGPLAAAAQVGAAALLVAHLLELPFAYRHLGAHPGPFWSSLLQSLLYGLMHWWPLARRRRDAGRTR